MYERDREIEPMFKTVHEPSRFDVSQEDINKYTGALVNELKKEYKLLIGRDLDVKLKEIPNPVQGSGIGINRLEDPENPEVTLFYALSHVKNMVGAAVANGFTIEQLMKSMQNSSFVYDEVGHMVNDTLKLTPTTTEELERVGKEKGQDSLETQLHHFITNVHPEREAKELLDAIDDNTLTKLQNVNNWNRSEDAVMLSAKILMEKMDFDHVDALRKAEHLQYYLTGPLTAGKVWKLFLDHRKFEKMFRRDEGEPTSAKEELIGIRHMTKMVGDPHGRGFISVPTHFSNLLYLTDTPTQKKMRELPMIRQKMIEAQATGNQEELGKQRTAYHNLLRKGFERIIPEFDEKITQMTDPL